MRDYALVLNAGSSSLKFCVFGHIGCNEWRIESRGQIDGIGTIPRLSAKDAQGRILIDSKIDCNGSHGIDVVGPWLRSVYGGGRIVGVGHRIVHGGAQFTGPTIITAQVLDDLARLIPLAPLHQPYNIDRKSVV